MQYPDQQTSSGTKINWKSVIIFYAIAFCLSAPFNSGYLLAAYQRLTDGTIFYKSGFLPAGLGTLIAALMAFRLDKRFSPAVTTFWGNSRKKNLVIAVVPLIVFTITGIPNNLHKNVHLYAFEASLVMTLYAVTEEIFWRGYLLNVLSPLGKFKNYLLLGILWWAWHFPFTRADGYTGFLLIIIISSFLIGTFVTGTRSWLTAVGLHALIVITSLGDNAQPLLYAGAAIIMIWILIDKLWKIDKLSSKQQEQTTSYKIEDNKMV